MESSPRRPHVAIFCFPFGSHTAAAYALARQLAAAAAAATFSLLSTARATALLPQFARPGKYPNLRIHAVPDGRPEGFVPDPREPIREVELFLAAAPGVFREGAAAAVRAAGGTGITCLVSDSFLGFAVEMASEMGVPMVQFFAGAPRSFLVHLHTDVLRRRLGTGRQVEGKSEEKLDFVPGLSALRVRDLPDDVVSGDLNSPFARMLHRIAENAPRAAAVVLATYEGLEPVADEALKTTLPTCFSVGPLELAESNVPQADEPDESGCLSWLDMQPPRSVVYVCFGSGIMSPPSAELAELAEGLDGSGAPFLWSIRESAKANLPMGFLRRTQERGLVVPWAPQPLVLAHPAVGAFVTHCGWNSVMESLVRGVPMICRPLLGDHRVIARAVADEWEVGVRMLGDAFTREGVVGAVNAVMRTDAGRKMREGACLLGERATRALGPGGSSRNNLNRLVDMVCQC